MFKLKDGAIKPTVRYSNLARYIRLFFLGLALVPVIHMSYFMTHIPTGPDVDAANQVADIIATSDGWLKKGAKENLLHFAGRRFQAGPHFLRGYFSRRHWAHREACGCGPSANASCAGHKVDIP